MIEQFNFFAEMLNYILQNNSSDKISFSDITNWHSSHPYYRLNYYDDTQISQVLGIYLLFNKDFLSQFDNIIEIGSYNGGLSSYIFDNKRPDAKFVSYDIDESINTVKLRRPEIPFVTENCFSHKVVNDIKESLLYGGNKSLLICDGGNKTLEFIEFSPYIKEDDVIILHDYKQDDDSWKEYTDFWQWPYGNETSYEDIKEAIESNELIPYDNKRFNFYLWGAYTKKYNF